MHDAHHHAATPVYLDYLSTTPCDPDVAETMIPFFSQHFANPASSHTLGRQAAAAVRKARSQVAALLGACEDEIVFTASATESNNLAISGLAPLAQANRRRIVTTQVEHKSVLEPLRALEANGFDVHYLPVDHHGRVSLKAAKEAIDEATLLVSVQAANNEIGTLQPIQEVAEIAHRVGAIFHSDAAQAIGKVPFLVSQAQVDLVSVSAHKLYGPKGIGALYIRGGASNTPLEPIIRGGGQESGLRSGTSNVPAIVGFGLACELRRSRLLVDLRRIAQLRDKFERTLTAGLPCVSLNGDLNNRLPNCSSIQFRGIRADEILANCPLLAASLGSACTAGTPAPSHVLQATGLSTEQADSTIRFSFGRQTTVVEIETVVETIAAVVAKLSQGCGLSVLRPISR
jgi:cysteine desulfurase